MKRFKRGDTVISLITLKRFGVLLEKDKFYAVDHVSYCVFCGTQSIAFGCSVAATHKLCVCGFIQPTNNILYTHADKFILADENAMEAAAEQDNYDLAIAIREHLKQKYNLI